jgi:hypothetical protein
MRGEDAGWEYLSQYASQVNQFTKSGSAPARFVGQPAGLRDTVRGITQFIVGTGGAGLTGIRVPVQPNSVTRIQGHHGVLKLTLGAEEYQHAFIDTQGRIWDRAAGKCH